MVTVPSLTRFGSSDGAFLAYQLDQVLGRGNSSLLVINKYLQILHFTCSVSFLMASLFPQIVCVVACCGEDTFLLLQQLVLHPSPLLLAVHVTASQVAGTLPLLAY